MAHFLIHNIQVAIIMFNIKLLNKLDEGNKINMYLSCHYVGII